MSKLTDNPGTVGEIIALALERRKILVPKQKALEAIASSIGVDPRTMRRWIEDEGQPDLAQFGTILFLCNYPEGWDQIKIIHHPTLQ